MYIEFYFLRQVKVDRPLSLPQGINLTKFVCRIHWTLCHASRQTRYHAGHKSGCLARVSSSTAVYEVRLTNAQVTRLGDGCYVCELNEESRARRLTG